MAPLHRRGGTCSQTDGDVRAARSLAASPMSTASSSVAGGVDDRPVTVGGDAHAIEGLSIDDSRHSGRSTLATPKHRVRCAGHASCNARRTGQRGTQDAGRPRFPCNPAAADHRDLERARSRARSVCKCRSSRTAGVVTRCPRTPPCRKHRPTGAEGVLDVPFLARAHDRGNRPLSRVLKHVVGGPVPVLPVVRRSPRRQRKRQQLVDQMDGGCRVAPCDTVRLRPVVMAASSTPWSTISATSQSSPPIGSPASRRWTTGWTTPVPLPTAWALTRSFRAPGRIRTFAHGLGNRRSIP